MHFQDPGYRWAHPPELILDYSQELEQSQLAAVVQLITELVTNFLFQTYRQMIITPLLFFHWHFRLQPSQPKHSLKLYSLGEDERTETHNP